MSSRRRGATFVEMLFAIAIIVMLLALFLPAIHAGRRSARRVQCSNHLRQIGIALHSYHNNQGVFPAGWVAYDETGSPGYGWAVPLLYHLENRTLAGSFTPDDPIVHPVNAGAGGTQIATYQCAADLGDTLVEVTATDANGAKKTFTFARMSYLGSYGSTNLKDYTNTGPCDANGVFYRNSRIRLVDITDGTSHTILVGERRSDGTAGIWIGAPHTVKNSFQRVVAHSRTFPSDSGDPMGFSSFHAGGGQFLFGDSAVRFLSSDVDSQIYQAMATRAGEELRAAAWKPIR